MLRNLLDNAVEHGEGADVVVTVAADRDAVAVAVRDRGVGFGPGEQHLVFDRFWRADPARARTTGGTGLGLAIALEDTRLHRGWLQAWGERGKGSVFRLTLPRRLGEELAGSPLPLGPDEADEAAGVLARPADGTAGPAGNGMLPPLGNGLLQPAGDGASGGDGPGPADMAGHAGVTSGAGTTGGAEVGGHREVASPASRGAPGPAGER